MSDYLWDKTGEPDEEVRRLEELLGGFRQEPRPLALPAQPELVSRGPAARVPRWALAVAAAVLLAALAGAFVALRPGGGGAGDKQASNNTELDAPSVAAPRPAPTSEPDKRAGRVAREGDGERRAERRRRAAGAKAGRSFAPRAVEVRDAAEVAQDERGSRAKDQLFQALRLTSAKLEEVRKRVRGEGETAPEPAGLKGTR